MLLHVFPAPPRKKVLVRTGKPRRGTFDPEIQDFLAPYAISACPDRRSGPPGPSANMCEESSGQV